MDKIALRQQLSTFLAEDIGSGDITSQAIFSANQQGKAVFIAKESFICAGLAQVAAEVFRLRIGDCPFTAKDDGTRVSPGQSIFSINGPINELLQAERVALNLVQRLSGIATLTSRFVEEVKEYPVRIVDTRKTTPGLRMLEKYAVRVGGGHNHRFNLTDGVLLKDNHIAACSSIFSAVKKIRETIPHTIRIEVEAETLAQVNQCLEAKVDIIMLDNMDCQTMKQAVDIIDKKAITEASGNVNLTTVKEIASTGVDIISIGALTHSAPAVDISMALTIN